MSLWLGGKKTRDSNAVENCRLVKEEVSAYPTTWSGVSLQTNKKVFYEIVLMFKSKHRVI